MAISQKMKKKAVYFTIDAIIGVTIILFSLALISTFSVTQREEANVQFLSSDLVKVFTHLKVNDLNNNFTKTLIANGSITRLNNSVFEQLGEFWAEGNDDIAQQFIANISDELIADVFGFSILLDGEVMYTNNKQLNNLLISSRKIISGIAKDRPVEGFTSRAFLKSIKEKKFTTYAYYGGFVGQGNITVFIDDIPSGVSILDMELELDAGSLFNFFVNGNPCLGPYTPSGGTMTADKWNITSCQGSLALGSQNNFTVEFPGAIVNSFIGGGFVKVTYLTDQFIPFNGDNTSTTWLPEIRGIINLFSSFYVPGTLDDLEVYLHYFAISTNATNTLFISIANQTVARFPNSTGEGNVTLTNINLTPLLNYAQLGEKTVPIRIGFENVSFFSIFEGNADVGLITDVSGSMDDAMNSTATGTLRNCEDVDFTQPTTRRISVAKCLDKEFAADIVNISGNKVGLVSFNSDTVSGDTVYPTTSLGTINTTVGTSIPLTGYTAGGGTCICCGIESAKDILVDSLATSVLIAEKAAWKFTTDYYFSSPPNDTENDHWTEQNFDDTSWSTGNAILGATNGLVYSPLVDTEIGSNLSTSSSFADLWEDGDDNQGAPNDFTAGPLNSTANTFGLTNGNDGWDWDTLNGAGPFGYDDDMDYNGVTGGRLTVDSQTAPGSDNNCNNHDCSGAYGLEVNVTQELYDLVLNGGTVEISFYYEWDGNDNPFEGTDEVWVKAYWQSPTTGIHYLGAETSSADGDGTLEVHSEDNPDTEFSGIHTEDITSWVEGTGMYYLALGGKVQASANDEWGTFYFDDVQVEFIEVDPSSIYADLWEHGADVTGPPNDFTGGILNYTANTYGISGADDGWDWDSEDGGGQFSYDDNIDYNEIVGGELEFDNADDSSGSDNSCANNDCSGAYGIEIEITQEMVDIINEDGAAILSFAYEWSGNPANTFESEDQVWIKARWTSPTSGTHMLGGNLDGGETGADGTFEVATQDNPDVDFSGTYSQDVSPWVEGAGFYYLELGGKLLGSESTEWGAWQFDNVQLRISNITNHYYFRKSFTVPDLSLADKGILNVLSDDSASVYINGVLIDDDPDTHLANNWNRRGKTFDGSLFTTGTNVVAVQLDNAERAAKFDLELRIINDSRGKAMMVMSDGRATYCCGGWDCADTTAAQEAIDKACEVRENYGIQVFAVGYSDEADEATMSAIADCGEGIFEQSSNVSALQSFYEDVASSIVSTSRKSQTIEVEGDVTESILYGDSYILVNYTPTMPPPFNEIALRFEEKSFKNCSFNVSIFPGLRIVDAVLTSYSSEHWTDYLEVNGVGVFNLSSYSTDYTVLGDPFAVNIPPSVLNSGNNSLKIRTGDVPWNSTGCSQNNTFVYTGGMSASVAYSEVLEGADGCAWTIETQEDGNITASVPGDYSGSDNCEYTSTGNAYNINDSIEVAVNSLLGSLDFDGDGKININIDEADLEIESLFVGKVPSLWGPTIAEIQVWE